MPTVVPDAPDGSNRFAQRLFSPLPDRYDRLAEWLSFGQNGRWRRAMVDHVVEASPRFVLDVAAGPFDAVTFPYLLRYVDDPAAAIGELARVVKPGGVMANLEFNVPASSF